jgi:hypothetical protein
MTQPKPPSPSMVWITLQWKIAIPTKVTMEIRAHKNLKDFTQHNFMLWSPRVTNRKKLNELAEIKTLELVINENYTMKIDELIIYAKENAGDTNNPFMRSLQLLEALKR